MNLARDLGAKQAAVVNSERVLLVEGPTPANFFEAFLLKLGLSDEIEVRIFGGNAELPSYLRVLARTDSFRRKVTSLGIVRDAEGDAKAAASSLKDAIEKAGIPGQVRVATFVLPDNHGPGMLETLCMRAVADDESFDCVEGFFRCLSSKGIALMVSWFTGNWNVGALELAML